MIIKLIATDIVIILIVINIVIKFISINIDIILLGIIRLSTFFWIRLDK